MKSNIMCLMVCAFALSESASAHAAQKVTSNFGGFLVFQRGKKLECVNLRSGKTSVLRDVFLFDEEYNVAAHDWQMSPDGRRVAFTDYPRDGDFFNAAAWRKYLWTIPYQGKQRVLLAAYGPRADKRDYSFESPSWSNDGRKLLLSRAITGSVSEPGELALYNVLSRREEWNSGSIAAQILPQKASTWNNLSKAALSPDGSRVICLATLNPNNGFSLELPEGRKTDLTSLVLFNISQGKGRIVGTVDDQFSVPRYRFEGNEQISSLPIQTLNPQFAWHPTEKKIAFVGPDSPTNPKRDLFVLNLSTGKITSLVNDPGDNFSPQWSQDGKSIFWIHGSLKPEKAQNNEIFCVNADGSNARHILPQIKGVTQIQLLPHIADWSQYRKLSIEPLAGADK